MSWKLMIATLFALLVMAGAMFGPGTASAVAPPEKGTFKGATKQSTVVPSARTLEFRIRKGKIFLTEEPLVKRGDCLKGSVFLGIDGTETASKKLGGGGGFTFSRTFVGSKVDKIRGRFVSATEIEGEVIYNFDGGDTGACTDGKTRVKFTARRGKKKG